jgi:hypothetical protein
MTASHQNLTAELPKVTIRKSWKTTANGVTSRGTDIEINGKKVECATEYSLSQHAEKLTFLTIKIAVGRVEYIDETDYEGHDVEHKQ